MRSTFARFEAVVGRIFILGFFLPGFLFAANSKEEMDMVNSLAVKELTMQFAEFFTNKDIDGISALLTNDFDLYDPSVKWLRGKERVVEVLKKQFQETKNVSYEVVNAYEDGNVGILEFKITLDDLILYGVDFMRWENGKMTELRCYYNPPDAPQHEVLKPLSVQAKSIAEGAVYEHYKGKRYKILSVGRNSETLEESVVYQDEKHVWIRPLKVFLENVNVNGQTLPRFKRIEK